MSDRALKPDELVFVAAVREIDDKLADSVKIALRGGYTVAALRALLLPALNARAAQ